MRERFRQLGGILEIQSDGNGTLVRAVLPVGPRREMAGQEVRRRRALGESKSYL
jgi:signal transduction histidine kinase